MPPKYIITPKRKIITSTLPISPWASVRAQGMPISTATLAAPRRLPMGSVSVSRYLAITMMQASFTNSEGWIV